jgi:uncharacterized protein (TIGR02453 family)
MKAFFGDSCTGSFRQIPTDSAGADFSRDRIDDGDWEHGMEKIFKYLSGLESNNNREWYRANKQQYQEASAEFESLIQELLFSIGKVDEALSRLNPGDLVFRLARDTRFSNDKTPYTPAFRACMAAGGKQPVPVGYYISIAPGKSFLGGGLNSARLKDATAMIRDHIAGHGDEWASIITEKDFSRYFSVQGEALKKVPRGYDEAHPQARHLKNKSWYVQYPIPDDRVKAADFVEQAAGVFLRMKPFNDFLNTALKAFTTPHGPKC